MLDVEFVGVMFVHYNPTWYKCNKLLQMAVIELDLTKR